MLLCFVSFALVVHAMNTVVVHQWETGHIGFSCKTCTIFVLYTRLTGYTRTKLP